MTPGLQVRVAIITKTFTATVVLQLMKERHLVLDDSLASHIAGLPNGDEITLRQVLGMSAGIISYVLDAIIAIECNRNSLIPFSPEDAPAIIQRSTPDFAPGERVQYSDGNDIVLGTIIERVTGQPAGVVITERSIDPLGLVHTSFPTTPDLPSPYARGMPLMQRVTSWAT